MSTLKQRKKPKNEYRHGDLKGALIKAAIESIGQTGEVSFSLRDLAEKAGVTHAAAYRHFSSKKDILLEISKEGFLNLSAEFKKILSANSENIEDLGIAYVNFAINHPHHFKVMFHPDVKPMQKADFDSDDLGKSAYDYLCDSVEANKKAGRFLNDSTQNIALSAWVAVHGLSTLLVNEHIQKKSKKESLELAVLTTSHLMKGFLKR